MRHERAKCLGFVLALTAAPTVFAQPTGGATQPLPSTPGLSLEARAQALYLLGRESYHNQSWDEAQTAFVASLQLVESPNTRMYLGRVLRRLGRVTEAYVTLDRAARDAAARAQTEPRYEPTRDSARAEATDLEPLVARVLVQIDPVDDALTLSVNDHAVPRAGWDVPLALDPGEATLTLSGPGWRTRRETVTLVAGHLATVALHTEHLPASPPPPPPPSPPPGAEGPPRANPWRSVGVVALATGGVALTLGGALWLWAWNDHQTLTGQWQSLPPDVTLPNQGDVDAAETRQRFGYLALGVGAGLAAAGAVTWLLAQPRAATPRAVTLTLGPGAVGVAGSF